MSTDQGVEVTRWYTSALKIPRLIGKLPSGERLWGGPYTLTQGTVGVGVFIVGFKTMGWWGYSNLLINGITLLAVSATALFLVGMIPSNGVNPAVLIQGSVSQLARRDVGTWRGNALQIPDRATALGGRVSLAEMPEMPSRPRPVRAEESSTTGPRQGPTRDSAPQARLAALLKQGGNR